jgi:hypothetical protein
MAHSSTSDRGSRAGHSETQKGAPPNGSAAEDARHQAVQRAEELADRWAEQVGTYASSLTREFFRLAARAREEAQDIWAEAQAIRRGEREA